MGYKYTHFIEENIAPKGAKNFKVYDSSGKEVCLIGLGNMAQPKGTKLYSFGLLSDIHLWSSESSWNGNTKFDNALTYFENQGCAFCTHSGDMTQTGLYNEGDTVNLAPQQFSKYKQICDSHSIPVYGCCGNHESYVVPITNNLVELKNYTGTDLYYSINQGNDVFIFVGQPQGNKPMGDDALQWLSETLETNKNKRCFIFVHPHISSGNPLGAYTSNPIFGWWGTKTDDFKNLLNQYKKTILFHGHTHVKFECQEQDKTSTYSKQDGFHSVHVPSSGTPRDVVDGALVNRTDESQGYIVDVYDSFIVLNGLDLINEKPVPLGTFKIRV
jgi:predicted phosphodiesterase